MPGDGGRFRELEDLALVQQQPPGAFGLVLLEARAEVRLNIRAVEKHLAVLDTGKRLVEIGEAAPDRLDLGPLQLDPRLEPVEDVVIVRGAAVDGNIGGHGPGKQRWRREVWRAPGREKPVRNACPRSQRSAPS